METSSQMTGTGPALPLFISKNLPQPNQKKKKKQKNLVSNALFPFPPITFNTKFYRILTKVRYKKYSHKKDTEKPVPAEIWSPK